MIIPSPTRFVRRWNGSHCRLRFHHFSTWVSPGERNPKDASRSLVSTSLPLAVSSSKSFSSAVQSLPGFLSFNAWEANSQHLSLMLIPTIPTAMTTAAVEFLPIPAQSSSMSRSQSLSYLNSSSSNAQYSKFALNVRRTSSGM